MEAMVGEVEAERQKAGIKQPVRFTCSMTDGKNVYALRYSSDRSSKTLYVNHDRTGMEELMGDETPRRGAHIVLSEPLDECSENWREVPESSWVTVCKGRLDIEPFRPSA